eukprot:10928786-Alexandrium_andersonii.AAC.1
MINGALAARAHSPARGPPGQQAPSKVRVNVRAESGPLVLPRKMVHAPGTDNQVANQPDKRCPTRGGGGRHSPATLLSCEPQVWAIHAK